MACKRSSVRSRLAPPFLFASPESAIGKENAREAPQERRGLVDANCIIPSLTKCAVSAILSHHSVLRSYSPDS